MAYKRLLDPPNEQELKPGWTWGQHREMMTTLDELEMEDDALAAAHAKLDAVMREVGIDPDTPLDKTHFVCEFCGKDEWIVHDEKCPDFDQRDVFTRDAAAYQYWDSEFVELHTTSVPGNDEEAADYFRIVTIWFPDHPPMYVLRKEFGGSETFAMIPWLFIDGKVVPHESRAG